MWDFIAKIRLRWRLIYYQFKVQIKPEKPDQNLVISYLRWSLTIQILNEETGKISQNVFLTLPQSKFRMWLIFIHHAVVYDELDGWGSLVANLSTFPTLGP